MRILLVEDEVDLAEAVASSLRREGYAVDVAFDGEAGLELAVVHAYDLAVIDWNLPGIDGMRLCQQVRDEAAATFVLLLTARASVADRVAGLDAGADDYLTKPFATAELLARVRALLRRDQRLPGAVLAARDLRLDLASRRAWQGDRPLQLTRLEYSILEYLIRHAGEVISQETLLEHVWDAHADPFTNTVRVHILSLRRKLGDNTANPRYIETIVGRGYRLGVDGQAGTVAAVCR